MSTQRTEEQKLNPKPCKVGHCDNMCYCTEDKTTTDESVVEEYEALLAELLDESRSGEYVGSFHHAKIKAWLTSKDAQHKAEVEAEVEKVVETARHLVRRYGTRMRDGEFKAFMNGLKALTNKES